MRSQTATEDIMRFEVLGPLSTKKQLSPFFQYYLSSKSTSALRIFRRGNDCSYWKDIFSDEHVGAGVVRSHIEFLVAPPDPISEDLPNRNELATSVAVYTD